MCAAPPPSALACAVLPCVARARRRSGQRERLVDLGKARRLSRSGCCAGQECDTKRNARLAPGKLAHLEAPGALAMNIEPTAMLGNSESVGQRFVTCDQHFAAGRGWPGGDYHIGSGESGVVTMRDSPFERAHIRGVMLQTADPVNRQMALMGALV
jgi:hypothetical protein